MRNSNLPEPLDDSAGFASLLHDYGERWQITREYRNRVWWYRAVRRPLIEHDKPIWALSINQMRDALDAAERGAFTP